MTGISLYGQPIAGSSSQSINDVRQLSITSSRAPIFDSLIQKSDTQFGSIYTFTDSSSQVSFQQFSRVIEDFIDDVPHLGFRLKTTHKSTLDPTMINYRYEQLYDGMPIVNAGYAISLEDGEITNNSNAEVLQRPATFDIIGHELGHTFFGRNISGNDGDTKAIEEGVADILGTYAESVVQGNVDFLIGDDTPNGDAIFEGRPTDLANHPYSCRDNLPDCDINDGTTPSCRYDRSGPILSWFANLVQGVPTEMIEPIDIFDVTAVVVEAVTLMDENDAQLEDFRDATLAATLNQFGQCSAQFTSIARSWNSVCLGVIPVCPITLVGPVSHCVDNGNPSVVFSLGIQDPLPNVTYRWNFPPEWTVSGVANGIGTKDGLGILVLDAPTYNSYPRTFLVQVYPIQLGSAFKARVNFRFKECSGGGGSNCGLAFGLGESNNDAFTFKSSTNPPSNGETTATNAIVFDLLGRKVVGLSGSSETEMLKRILTNPDTPNIFFVSFTDSNGQLIKTTKYVNTSRL